MESGKFWFAFGLLLFAGLSTLIERALIAKVMPGFENPFEIRRVEAAAPGFLLFI